MTISERMQRLLEGRGFKVGTRRKWKSGYFVKQADGTWVPDAGDIEKSAPGFVNYGKGWVPKSDAPPPPEPPVAPTGAKPPDEKDVEKATVRTLPATARKMALFTTADSKGLGAALKEIRAEGKEKGKLSASKYVHKLKAESEIAPEKQAAVRTGMRKLLADFGLTSQDVAKGKNKANNLVVARGEKGVCATHEYGSGLVTIRADETDDAAKFFAKGGKNPTADEVGGAHSLLHEEIHGCSPVSKTEWQGGSFIGNRSFIEETTTELCARKILRDAYGLSYELTTHETLGSYEDEIETLRLMTLSALFKNGIDTPDDHGWWEDFMGEAALRVRSSKHELGIGGAYEAFVKSLPITDDAVEAAAKLQGKKVAEVREGIVDSFKEALKNQAAYGQEVRRNYLAPWQVKRAKEILAKVQKKDPTSEAKIWRKRNGSILIASKLGHSWDELGAELLEDWMKKRGMKWESVEAVPVYDPQDVGPEMIWTLQPNDVMKAVALAFALAKTGLLESEHLSMLAQLQDHPELFEEATADLETGLVVRM